MSLTHYSNVVRVWFIIFARGHLPWGGQPQFLPSSSYVLKKSIKLLHTRSSNLFIMCTLLHHANCATNSKTVQLNR